MSAYDNLLHALFTTALEGGIGYWSECEKYHWSTDGGDTEDLRGFYAIIVEAGDGDGDVKRLINRQVMAHGYKLATGEWRDRVQWSSGENPPRVVTDETDWDFDAGDADIIVQLGLGLIDTAIDGRTVVRYG